MKVFVGVAPFQGELKAPTVASLLAEQLASVQEGVALGVQILSGAHYVAEAYNLLLARFMRSDFDKFATIEWDVSWDDAGALSRLSKLPYDYVGAATRYKREPEEYMVGWLGGEGDPLWGDKHGCIEVQWIPQGFTVASRAMCQAMWDAAADREYSIHGEVIRQVYFEDWRPGRGKAGQDIGLCLDWRDMGGKVHVAPEIELTHTACHNHSYKGRLGDWLRARMATSPEKADAA